MREQQACNNQEVAGSNMGDKFSWKVCALEVVAPVAWTSLLSQCFTPQFAAATAGGWSIALCQFLGEVTIGDNRLGDIILATPEVSC